MSYILTLDQCSFENSARVGVKAAALGELRRAGFRVPNGFVITAEAYPSFIAPLRDKIAARLTDDVVNDPAELEGSATEIREWIGAQVLPAALRAEVETALDALSASERTSLIARSSTAADDLATSFGAGVARAYAGLVGIDEIARAIARAWAALWNSRAIYYRWRKKIVQTEPAFAILIQPMVRADSAGVILTEHPITGNRDEMEIKSVFGLGMPVMNGRFHPDEFIFDKSKNEITDRTQVEQAIRLAVGDDGHVEEQVMPAAQADTSSLTDAQIAELAALGQRVQTFFKTPQDIEWTLANGEFVIVQARPIGMRHS